MLLLISVFSFLQFASSQTFFELYRSILTNQADRANAPPITIEIFGESLCPDTTRFLRQQLMPTWNALQSNGRLNVSYHPFGLASCSKNIYGTRCNCQHGQSECQLNQLQACVISALQVPQLYLPIVSCIQGKRKFYSAIDDCIVNFRPRPDLDENFMIRCAESQLGVKLLNQHGEHQHKVAPKLDWVPWIMINGERSRDAENMFKTVICKKIAKNEYCSTPEEAMK